MNLSEKIYSIKEMVSDPYDLRAIVNVSILEDYMCGFSYTDIIVDDPLSYGEAGKIVKELKEQGYEAYYNVFGEMIHVDWEKMIKEG